MNIHELDSYDLGDAVKFNDQLNPRIWGADERMRPEVREQLLRIADDFREFLGIDVEVKDITVSGSNAAYTYTPHSDIDLHLVVDLPEADANEVYRELFDAKKYAYNDQHDIRIGGADVELYVQDANKKHHSQGIYSIINDDWVSVPRRRRPDVDDISVKSKFEDLGHRIEAAIQSRDYEKISALTDKLKDYRQAGLDAHGEFGPENLAFKILRTQGLIQKLYDARNAAKDALLSLDERRKKKKKRAVKYGYGAYWYPGTAYAGQDHPAGTEGGGDGGGDGGESLREDAGATDEDILKDFIDFCVKELKILHMPRVKLRRDPQWPAVHKTFGRYNDEAKTLEVAWGQRHIMDVLRTVAHELTHKHQHEREGEKMGPDAGETGSPYENEANARAGVLMRDYGRLHPEYFTVGQAHGLHADEIKETAPIGFVMPGMTTDPVQAWKQQVRALILQYREDPTRLGELAKEKGPDSAEATAYAYIRNPKARIPLPSGATVQESASGYIPTKRQAKDPRYSMALTQDIRPGQVGKEANKLRLKTDSQGHPQIANPNGLFEQLMREYQAVKEKKIFALADEDYDPDHPPGPEFKPTMPAGTLRVDVSDVYDWYKLGQHISNMKGLGQHDFGKGPPSTIVSFGDEDTEHKFIGDIAATGLDVTDIDPADPKKRPGRKIKTDPTYNVNEAEQNFAIASQPIAGDKFKLTINNRPFVLTPGGFGKQHSQVFLDSFYLTDMKSGKTEFVDSWWNWPMAKAIADHLDQNHADALVRIGKADFAWHEKNNDWDSQPPRLQGIRRQTSLGIPAKDFVKSVDAVKRVTGQDLNELALKSTLPVTQALNHPNKQVYDLQTQSGEYKLVFHISDKDENFEDDPDYDGPTGYSLDIEYWGKTAAGGWTQFNTNVGEKQVAQIFATIAQLAVKIIKSRPEIDEIKISGVDPQRSRIYSRLMQQNIDSMLPGWKLGGAGLVREQPPQAVAEDKMSQINLDQKLARTPATWQRFVKGLPPQLAQEFVDERPQPDQEDLAYFTPLSLTSHEPVYVKTADLLRHPENQGNIARSPDDVIAAINQRWGTKIASGKKYDLNPGRYRKYSQMRAPMASPSVMVDGVIVLGVGRFVAAALRGDDRMRVWSMTRKQAVKEDKQVSTTQILDYIRKHHDPNLHKDYTDYIENTFSGFELKNVPVASIKTDLPKLDADKVAKYKTMDFSKAPPIVIGDGYILDGYHRANAAKDLGIASIPAYVGVKNMTEDEDLDEVKMSPSALEKFATSDAAKGIRAGFEAELIFRDTQGESDEMDPEPDYDADERAYSIQQVIEFFENDEYGYGLSDRERNRLEEGLDETYMTWRDEKITSDFRDEAEDLIRERLLDETPMSERIHMYLTDSEQMSDKEADKIIAAGADAPKFTKSSDQEAYAAENPYYQAYLDAADAAEMELDESVEYSVSQQDGYWDEALDDYRDNWSGDDDSFFSDVGLRWMSDIANEYNLDWPVWNMDARGNSGSRDWETIGALLQDAVDMPVKVSSNYHSAARREGQWIIEPDGSLSPDDPDDEAGLEIVSPPMPLLTAIEKLRQVTDWANNPKTGNAYTNSSTGLHMGVSLPTMKSEAAGEDIGIDYVKLILFLGDKYVQQQFGRTANTYCASALDKLKQNIKGKRSDPAGVVELLRHGLTELAHRELQKGVGTSKYTSAHIQPGYIEFRSPGGDWLAKADEEIGVLENTMLRFARAMAIAGDPSAERQEYAKKLYKLVTQDNEQYADQLRLFSEFSAGTINKEQLKKQWAETVLQKELPGTGKEEYEVYRRDNKDSPDATVGTLYAKDYDDAYDQFLRQYGKNINDLDVRIKQPWFDVFDDTGKTVVTIRAKDIDTATDRAQYEFGERWNDGWKIYRRPDDTPEPKASPRAQVAKRIAQPKPKAVGDDDASDWEAVYKPTGRVFDTLAHADTAQALAWRDMVMRSHGFTNVSDILVRRVGHQQAADARRDSADLQRNLGVQDVDIDVTQNFEPRRMNYELVSDEDPDRVIHRMPNATADEVRAWIAQQEQGGMPPGFLRTRIVAESVHQPTPEQTQEIMDAAARELNFRDFNDAKQRGSEFAMKTIQHLATAKMDLAQKQPFSMLGKKPSSIKQAVDQVDLANMTRQIQTARKLGDDVNENFADKKVKGKSRPGRVKRAGASCKGSVTDLRARAKKYSGEKAKMYHWCANMKSGRKK